MSSLRISSSAARAARALQTATVPTTTTTTLRAAQFSTSAARRGGGAHYDEPTGWLFGVKPGEKYKPEGWEKPFFWGFCGSLIVFACVYPFKPDTS